ncbi:hypothetical protein [Streptomyces sp. NPDC006446]|uniref:hypothetical protein n=1 Tax=Streptomyces sp. NPDC006446 TaxID=3154301 RepID=UPI0033ABCC8C
MLVLTVGDEPGPPEHDLAALMSDLVHVHAPTPAVVVLGAVVTDAVIEASPGGASQVPSAGGADIGDDAQCSCRRTPQAQVAQQAGHRDPTSDDYGVPIAAVARRHRSELLGA